jgi:hypothetical protein
MGIGWTKIAGGEDGGSSLWRSPTTKAAGRTNCLDARARRAVGDKESAGSIPGTAYWKSLMLSA